MKCTEAWTPCINYVYSQWGYKFPVTMSITGKSYHHFLWVTSQFRVRNIPIPGDDMHCRWDSSIFYSMRFTHGCRISLRVLMIYLIGIANPHKYWWYASRVHMISRTAHSPPQRFLWFYKQGRIDDYAKMVDQGKSDFYVVFTMSLCALGLKQLLISLLLYIIRPWY